MTVRRFASRGEWIAAGLADFMAAVDKFREERDDPRARMEVCLAGGATPEPLYRALAEAPLRLPVRLWITDERCVPIGSPHRNDTMIARTFRDCRWRPAPTLVPWPTTPTPEMTAKSYEYELERALGTAPRFDLCYLGLGTDGHTASLFPGDAALAVSGRLAITAAAPQPPHCRVTLTVPVLRAARRIRFVVAGPGKLAAIAALSARDPSIPASLVAGPEVMALYSEE